MKDKLAAWNSGKAVGERLAFSLDETQSILMALRRKQDQKADKAAQSKMTDLKKKKKAVRKQAKLKRKRSRR